MGWESFPVSTNARASFASLDIGAPINAGRSTRGAGVSLRAGGATGAAGGVAGRDVDVRCVMARGASRAVTGSATSKGRPERATMSGLNSSRADSIVGGAIVAEAVLEASRCGRFLVAGQGLREGVVLDSLLDIASSEARVGDITGLSDVDLLDDGRLLAITDQGDFVWLDLADDGVTPTRARIAPLQNAAGEPLRGKQEGDSEDLAYNDGLALVSFERDHRVLAFDIAGCSAAARGAPVTFEIGRASCRERVSSPV